jgi:hypothetical protein
MECTRPFYFSLLSVAPQGVDFCRQGAPRRPIAVTWTRLYDPNFAKVGVEGSNPRPLQLIRIIKQYQTDIAFVFFGPTIGPTFSSSVERAPHSRRLMGSPHPQSRGVLAHD